MLAIPFSLVLISLSLLLSHEARAAVLKSPRTVDLSAPFQTPTTLSSPTSAPLPYAPPILPSSAVVSINNSIIIPLHHKGQHSPPPPPSPPSTLTLAAETSTPAPTAAAVPVAVAAATVDMGNIPYEESVSVSFTTTTRVPAVAAAVEDPTILKMMMTAAPSPPPPVDPDAARDFREEYGDRYTQATYWSCQTEGVFEGHCGWHEPIIEIAAASSGAAAAAAGLALRAGVLAVGAVVVGGAAFAL